MAVLCKGILLLFKASIVETKCLLMYVVFAPFLLFRVAEVMSRLYFTGIIQLREVRPLSEIATSCSFSSPFPTFSKCERCSCLCFLLGRWSRDRNQLSETRASLRIVMSFESLVSLTSTPSFLLYTFLSCACAGPRDFLPFFHPHYL